MNGKIYLCFDASGLWKIGITKESEKRLKQMRTGNATIRMVLDVFVEYPEIIELELHTRFEDKNVSGEWFDLNPEDLLYVYDKLLGNENTHGIEDFIKLHTMISIEKKASNYRWLKEWDNFYEEYSR